MSASFTESTGSAVPPVSATPLPAPQTQDRPGSSSLVSPAFWLAVYALARRELMRFFRQRTRIIGALGQPVVFWMLFGTGLRGSFRPPDWAPTLSYAEYFFPGVMVMILLFTAIFSTISIIEDRREGFLQGVLAAPIPRLAIVLGKVLGGATLALLQVSLFLCLAPLGGVSIPLTALPALIPFLFLGGIALTSLGFLIAWPMNSTQGFHAIMSIVLMPMWLLSGAFFPAEGAGPLAWVIRANPMTYLVAGTRRLLGQGAGLAPTLDFPPFWASLAITLAFAVLCLGISVRLANRRRL
jgi:ABC-2 type transport system permease protein